MKDPAHAVIGQKSIFYKSIKQKKVFIVFRHITSSQHFCYRWRQTVSMKKFVIEFSVKQQSVLKTRRVVVLYCVRLSICVLFSTRGV